MKYEIIRTETKYEGWTRFLVVSVRSPDGALLEREIEDHGPAVAVLAYEPGRKAAILVRQFRAPAFFSLGQEHTLEAIAGMIDDKDSIAAAQREALEEVGLHLRALEYVATVWCSPGISTERITLFLAAYGPADRVATGGGVATEQENIEVVEMQLGELARLMDAGELVDMKTLVLVQALKLRQGKIEGRVSTRGASSLGIARSKSSARKCRRHVTSPIGCLRRACRRMGATVLGVD